MRAGKARIHIGREAVSLVESTASVAGLSRHALSRAAAKCDIVEPHSPTVNGAQAASTKDSQALSTRRVPFSVFDRCAVTVCVPCSRHSPGIVVSSLPNNQIPSHRACTLQTRDHGKLDSQSSSCAVLTSRSAGHDTHHPAGAGRGNVRTRKDTVVLFQCSNGPLIARAPGFSHQCCIHRYRG